VGTVSLRKAAAVLVVMAGAAQSGPPGRAWLPGISGGTALGICRRRPGACLPRQHEPGASGGWAPASGAAAARLGLAGRGAVAWRPRHIRGWWL